MGKKDRSKHHHMIRSASINDFRGFRNLRLEGLGAVNLLVGRNNSGKSSVLEALYLLAMAGDPGALWTTVLRRGEQLQLESQAGRPIQPELDVCHLFHGHDLKLGSKFSVKTSNAVPDAITCSVVDANVKENQALFASLQGDAEFVSGSPLGLQFEGYRARSVPVMPLTRRGGLRQDTFQLAMNIAGNRPASSPIATQFISTASLNVNELVNSWASVALTPDEDRVIQALKTLEPGIERIAAIGPGIQFFPSLSTRGGFIVRCSGLNRPIPIGSFGDGIWRLLALAIGLSRAKDGILFVDEIDSGLHRTAMADMWRMIATASKELNIQVFATAHGYDCMHSLASICDDEAIEKNNVTIHRIEAGKNMSIPYTSRQVRIVAEQDLEVR